MKSLEIFVAPVALEWTPALPPVCSKFKHSFSRPSDLPGSPPRMLSGPNPFVQTYGPTTVHGSARPARRRTACWMLHAFQ